MSPPCAPPCSPAFPSPKPWRDPPHPPARPLPTTRLLLRGRAARTVPRKGAGEAAGVCDGQAGPEREAPCPGCRRGRPAQPSRALRHQFPTEPFPCRVSADASRAPAVQQACCPRRRRQVTLAGPVGRPSTGWREGAWACQSGTVTPLSLLPVSSFVKWGREGVGQNGTGARRPSPQCPANPTTIQRTNTRRNERTRADRRRQAAARRSEQQLRRGLHGFAPASLLGPRRLQKFSVCVCVRGLQWAKTWGTNDLSPCPPPAACPPVHPARALSQPLPSLALLPQFPRPHTPPSGDRCRGVGLGPRWKGWVGAPLARPLIILPCSLTAG